MKRVLLILLGCAGLLLAQNARPISAPREVQVAVQLHARLTAHTINGQTSLPAVDEQHADTARIQSELNRTLPGQAVELSSGRGNAFLSGPLTVPRGVTLFLDRGVTLVASRRRSDYDLTPGSCRQRSASACKPLVLSYQAAYSGVLGNGVIDGRGLVPDLIEENESNDFTLAGITLRNPAHAAAFFIKGTGLTVWDVNIQAAFPQATGLDLLSDKDVTIRASSIQTAGAGIRIASDHWIFPSSQITLANNRLPNGHGLVIDQTAPGVQHVATLKRPGPPLEFSLRRLPPATQHKRRIVVAADGSGDVTSVQAAVNELPDDGGTILVKPGTYRGVVTVRKPNVRLEGTGSDPSQVVIVYGNSAGVAGGTFNSATFFVEADNFFARNLTIANDYNWRRPGDALSRTGVPRRLAKHDRSDQRERSASSQRSHRPVVHPREGGQAVALAVTADRAVFRHVRLLGRQDTLFANSRYCYSDQGPCQTTRQYFADSYIEGNVDFIFGDSRAVFDHCTLHGLAGNVMYTAQDKRYPTEPSGYVFTHCTLTADPGARRVAFGRPWRRYSTVVYLHCNLQAPVIPAGWQEWRHDGQLSLPTSFYAEFDSTGPGASPSTREPYAKQLTPRQAAAYATVHFLGGWNPTAVR